MTPSPARGRLVRLTALVAAFVLSAGTLVATPTQASAVLATDVTDNVDEATLVWGYSGYAQKGVFGPWAFSAATGNATISTGAAEGYAPGVQPATSLPAGTTTINVVKFTGGSGRVDGRTGEAALAFNGGFTINPYPSAFGAPDETYSDPIVTVGADGAGTVSFHMVLGAGVGMDGEPTPATDLGRVTLATFAATDAGWSGFTIIPAYSGVAFAAPDGETPQNQSCAMWGAWPSDFVAALPAMVRAHYYSTGCGGLQDAKPALPMVLTYAADLPVPAISVSQTVDIDRDGATVTVSGSGFLPSGTATNGTRPPLAGKFAGVYVVFGRFLDTWQPSAGAPSSARKIGDQQWAVTAANGGGAGAFALLGDDGTFSVELEVSPDVPGASAGNYGICTFAGSGAVYAPFEIAVPIAFSTIPTSIDLVITASGVPVEGVGALLTATVDPSIPGQVTFTRDGAEIANVDPDAEGVAELAVADLPAGDTEFGATFTPTDGLVYAPSTATQVVSVAAKPIPGVGSLTWGVKSSFRSYVTGPIANGAIATSGASMSGSAFVFTQKGASSVATAFGSVAYGGSVRFTGHSGALDLTFSDPLVRIDSATAATLLLRINGGVHVVFARLDLAAATRSTASDGSISYTGAPATLTSAGASAFAFGGTGFYPAGTPLDSLSFVAGSAGAAPSGGGTVAAYFPPASREPAPTPPATEGLTVEGDLTAGGEVTITGDGFQPDETGILVVLYSTPILLASDATADAAGRVVWAGHLPAGLTGEHTLTLQGSVDRGIVIDIAAADPVDCPVDSAELSWGFLESFRAYIDGSIAQGGWTVAEGAAYETPLFSWGTVTGGLDLAGPDADLAFTGSVRFTGHGGVLNTTIAHPRVVINGDRAVLLLDVTGTTQDGEPIALIGVEFADLDLGSIEPVDDGGAVVLAGIPATLTAAGAAAFGTYEAGTALDPVTLEVLLGSDCLEPVVDEAPAALKPVATADDGPIGWIIAGVLALLAIVALVVALGLRGRRTA